MQQDFLGQIIFGILKQIWPFLVLFVVVWLVLQLIPLFFWKWKQRRKFFVGEKFRSGRELITWQQGLKPSEFEDYTAHLFKSLGYTVEVTGGAYDGGIDVIAEKDGVKHYIQCKKYITRQVPVGAVRDFYGAMADKGASAKGFFITTNTFTLEAEKFAEGKPIELIDGLKLSKYIEMTKTGYVPGEAKRFCTKCNSVMVKRMGKFGEFYGCSRYPDCKETQKI